MIHVFQDGDSKWVVWTDTEEDSTRDGRCVGVGLTQKNFAAIRRSILLKILASPLLPTRITQKPVGPRLTGLLFCSGVLRKL